MDHVYDIVCQGKRIGKATMKRGGLYCEIACNCKLPDAQIYRIIICTDTEPIYLGVYIPAKEKNGLIKKIPMKRLENLTNFQFRAVTERLSETVKIEAGKPLPVIDRIELLSLQNNMLCVEENTNQP